MIRNQITDLLRHERVRTTEARARELRREAEKVITLAKHNDVHHRRLALTKVYDPKVVEKLFAELGRSEEHTSELQSRQYLVCRLLLEKKKQQKRIAYGRWSGQ